MAYVLNLKRLVFIVHNAFMTCCPVACSCHFCCHRAPPLPKGSAPPPDTHQEKELVLRAVRPSATASATASDCQLSWPPAKACCPAARTLGTPRPCAKARRWWQPEDDDDAAVAPAPPYIVRVATDTRARVWRGGSCRRRPRRHRHAPQLPAACSAGVRGMRSSLSRSRRRSSSRHI